VYFTTLGSQGRRWSGQLAKVEPTPTVTNNVVLYNALFDVPNHNRSLMTQMTAQVFFVAAEARDVLTVPVSALVLQRGAARREAVAAGSPASAPARAPARAAARAAASAPAAAHATQGRGPRRATVKVQAADGSLQAREVMVGISNRVQAEIVSGLQEGEKVVAGMRQADTARRASGNAGAPGGMGAAGLGPGFGPPGGPPAGTGRTR
jgi:macrolide-specific efflux system membrane fusion protein